MNNIASKRRFMFFRDGKLVYTGVVPAAAGVLPHNVVEWAYGKLKSVGIPPEKDDVFVFKDKAFKLTFVSRTCGIKYEPTDGYDEYRNVDFHCKRVVELGKLLALPKNQKLAAKFPMWAEYADKKASEDCPDDMDRNIFAFHVFMQKYCHSLKDGVMPERSDYNSDVDFAKALLKMQAEKSQMLIMERNGNILCEPVGYDADNMKAFLNTVWPICAEVYDKILHDAERKADKAGFLTKGVSIFKAGTSLSEVKSWVKKHTHIAVADNA